jgi:flagellar basal-body rod modification protein FlgD
MTSPETSSRRGHSTKTPSRITVAVGPNPARGSADVRLDLARAAEAARVAIFDARGARVRTLLAGSLPAGSRSLRWDGRDERGREARAGVYWASVVAENGRAAARFVVIR